MTPEPQVNDDAIAPPLSHRRANAPEILELGPDDWERARSLRLASLRDTPDAFWATLHEESDLDEAAWRSRLAGDHDTFVAAVAGNDVAIAIIGPHYDDPSDACLTGVWAAPEARGTGVAEALVLAATDRARERGFPRIRLDRVDHEPRAISFYRRLGFTETDTVATFRPPREHITATEMTKLTTMR